MVTEGTVLSRIKYFKKRCRRIAVKIHCDLIHLVKKKNRIPGARTADPFKNAPGHRPDISTPVSAYLRLITDTSERDADELAPHRTRNRCTERGLADAGRACKAENGRILLRCKTPNSKIVEDAFFDFFEAIVIVFEHGICRRHINMLFRHLRPRELYKYVEIAADNTDLCAHCGAHIETVNLALNCLTHSIWKFF